MPNFYQYTNSDYSPCHPVTIDTGTLSGLNLPNNTRAFLGIPYAAPPIDDLRWCPPQRLTPWSGIRTANKFGPASLQFPPPPESIYSGGEVEFSEDCLYLNVWTGAADQGDSQGTEKRAVLVGFHFGAFQMGSGTNPVYDGRKMAEAGIVVVTVNYRLGRFGFLALPQLSAESKVGTSGNYGIMDQIAALEWVRRNIEVFGGDSRNVTIAGVSAGGHSVHILRCSPMARGLFSKAICESGPGIVPVVDGPSHLGSCTTLKAAERAGEELLDILGVSSVAELRKVSADKIMQAHLSRTNGPWKADLWPGSSSLNLFDTKYPIIDGYMLPDSPLTTMQLGKAADVPMLVGHADNEASGILYLGSLADYHTYVKDAFQEYAEEVLSLYPATNDSEVRTATSQFLADQVFVWPTWTSARLQAKNLKSPVWYYRFQRAPPIPANSNVVEKGFAGAFHCANVFYAFGNLDAWQWSWTNADEALSKNVLETWVRFVRTGDPNTGHEQTDVWPSLDSCSQSIKTWDLEPQIEEPDPRFRKMVTLLDKYYRLENDVDP